MSYVSIHVFTYRSTIAGWSKAYTGVIMYLVLGSIAGKAIQSNQETLSEWTLEQAQKNVLLKKQNKMTLTSDNNIVDAKETKSVEIPKSYEELRQLRDRINKANVYGYRTKIPTMEKEQNAS